MLETLHYAVTEDLSAKMPFILFPRPRYELVISAAYSWFSSFTPFMMVCQPMPPSEPLRVFISYARKDGTRLAQRLQSDLSKEGFDA